LKISLLVASSGSCVLAVSMMTLRPTNHTVLPFRVGVAAAPARYRSSVAGHRDPGFLLLLLPVEARGSLVCKGAITLVARCELRFDAALSALRLASLQPRRNDRRRPPCRADAGPLRACAGAAAREAAAPGTTVHCTLRPTGRAQCTVTGGHPTTRTTRTCSGALGPRRGRPGPQ
jgi:hypothetical protein